MKEYYCHLVSILLPPSIYITATGCLYYCHQVSILLPSGVYITATKYVYYYQLVSIYYCHRVSTQLQLTTISISIL